MGYVVVDGPKPGSGEKSINENWRRSLRQDRLNEPVAKTVIEEKAVRGYGAVDSIRLQCLPLDDLLRARTGKIAEPDIGRNGWICLPQKQHIDRTVDRPVKKHLIGGRVDGEAVGADGVG